MESYDEFSRRARLMTDLHATAGKENDSKDDGLAGSPLGRKDSGLLNKASEAKKKSLKRL